MAHDATERLMPLTEPGLTPSLYRKVLELLLSTVRSWEEWAAEAAPPRLRPLVSARRRSHLLERDLCTLHQLGVPPRNRHGQPVVDWTAAMLGGEKVVAEDTGQYQALFLGALYVLEGSTLGGRFIASHVEAALGLTPGQGDAYFVGHGAATGALWREVTAQIADVPEPYACFVIEAARRTFAAFGGALREGLHTGALGG